jgi:hypothetical protein
MNLRLRTLLKYWVPVAFLTAFACFVAYVTAQQVMRHMANDPQVQMAKDGAAALDRGRQPADLVRGDTIDISRSIAPFLIIFNEEGIAMASNATLDGSVPKPPRGVFCSCGGGENRVTWQPRRGVRIASVIVHHGGAEPGFVLAGRSLRESERRTARIGALLFVLWVVTALGSLAVIAAITRFKGIPGR